MNNLKRWPYIHFCLLDWQCWRDFYLYGMPLRLHYKKRFWEIPGLLWISCEISKRRWDWDHSIEINTDKGKPK